MVSRHNVGTSEKLLRAKISSLGEFEQCGEPLSETELAHQKMKRTSNQFLFAYAEFGEDPA